MNRDLNKSRFMRRKETPPPSSPSATAPPPHGRRGATPAALFHALFTAKPTRLTSAAPATPPSTRPTLWPDATTVFPSCPSPPAASSSADPPPLRVSLSGGWPERRTRRRKENGLLIGAGEDVDEYLDLVEFSSCEEERDKLCEERVEKKKKGSEKYETPEEIGGVVPVQCLAGEEEGQLVQSFQMGYEGFEGGGMDYSSTASSLGHNDQEILETGLWNLEIGEPVKHAALYAWRVGGIVGLSGVADKTRATRAWNCRLARETNGDGQTKMESGGIGEVRVFTFRVFAGDQEPCADP
ncbi:hypothetical protein KSP40_PGU006703 [Platanthera guangdongensis]|uniref:Uncharacterized protein n=1 Tax=Platanthera guangdongensis TaxID=2320717 RepID=A0ABR2MEW6_9ASPA